MFLLFSALFAKCSYYFTGQPSDALKHHHLVDGCSSKTQHSACCRTTFTGETCPRTHFRLDEILVLAGKAIPPAPPVPARTELSARLTRIGTQFTRDIVRTPCGGGEGLHVEE